MPTSHWTQADSEPPAETIRKKKKLLNGNNITFTYPSGSTYVGGFRDGKLHGYGVYTYVPSGDRYEGEWRADLKHGHGKYSYASGDLYVGEWYMGEKNGKGRFKFASGDEFTGNWKDDNMDGYGVFTTSATGNRYAGYWSQGVREGKGTLASGNGDWYDGDWSAGKEDGWGISREANGDVYCGEWKDGQMDGKGISREKGIKYYVEYMGGYLISKIRFDDQSEITEPGWEKSLQEYLAFEASEPATEAKLKRVFTVNPDDQDLEALRAENGLLRRRLANLTDGPATTTPAAAPSAEANAEMDGRLKQLQDTLRQSERTRSELQSQIDELLTRINLLENSLEERRLEQMRLKDTLRDRDATITGLTVRVEDFEAQVKRMKQQSGANAAMEDAAMTALRRDNAELLLLNSELQKKLSCAITEKTQLEEEVAKLDEQYEELRHAYAAQGIALGATQAEQASLLEKLSTGTVAVPLPSTQEAPSQTSVSVSSDADILAMSEETAVRKLVVANKQNAELTVRNHRLEKELNEAHEREASMLKKLTKGSDATIAEENRRLEEQLRAMRATMASAEASLEEEKRVRQAAQRKQAEAEDALLTTVARPNTDATLVSTLQQKAERIQALEMENANLARLVDEYRADLDENARSLNAAKKKSRASDAQVTSTASDAEQLQKELKKAQKKLKKVVAERGAMGMQLYETQILLARAERALQMQDGGIAVFLQVSDPAEKSDHTTEVRSSCLSISESDPSLVVMRDCGTEQAYHFDHCFAPSCASETLFNELRRPLSRVWTGYQVAFVTLGQSQTGKTTLMTRLVPLIAEQLCVTQPTAAGDDRLVSATFKVAAVELTHQGALDASSGGPVFQAQHDDHGYVHLDGATYVECTGGTVGGVIQRLLKKRTQVDGRSHFWIQIQCTLTHKVRQTSITGRVTLLDLCGFGPIGSREPDVESARFANRTFQGVRDVLSALGTRKTAVPYSQSLETSLLYDVLGGNSITTVLGAVHSDDTQVESTIKTLTTLDQLSKVRNHPLLQDFVGEDVRRWQQLVSALSSDRQAAPQLMDIDDIYE